MDILIALVALLVGVVGGFLVARLDVSTARTEASQAREEAAELRAKMAEERTAQADLRTEVARAEQRFIEAHAQVAAARAERDAAQDRLRETSADREAIKQQFKLLSEQSLEQQHKKADEAASQRFKETERLVLPLAEQLKAVQEKLGDVEKERSRMAADMAAQIKQMRLSEESLRKETLSLSQALRTPQVRGSWGEQSLKRMVEISGLTSRVDFDEQVSATSADGDRQRPDMRIHLAGSKVVFVDSKVPLAAVLDAYNTDDEAAQATHLARFAKHVKKHIDDLASKQYWALDAGSPEFVVLYLGSDEFYRLAQEQIPDLHDYAARKNVMLASPGILIPMLHIVAHGWTQASLAESAGQVVRLGRDLHDRLATMGGHFSKMGRSLNAAVSDYNKGIASLERRVMVAARRFNDLDITRDVLAELETVDSSANQPAVAEMIEYEHQRELEARAFDDEPLFDVESQQPSEHRASGE